MNVNRNGPNLGLNSSKGLMTYSQKVPYLDPYVSLHSRQTVVRFASLRSLVPLCLCFSRDPTLRLIQTSV